MHKDNGGGTRGGPKLLNFLLHKPSPPSLRPATLSSRIFSRDLVRDFVQLSQFRLIQMFPQTTPSNDFFHRHDVGSKSKNRGEVSPGAQFDGNSILCGEGGGERLGGEDEKK